MQAYGVITEIQGANGVNMPGLSGKPHILPSSITRLRTPPQSRTARPATVLPLAAALKPTPPSSAPARWAAKHLEGDGGDGVRWDEGMGVDGSVEVMEDGNCTLKS